MLHCDVTSKELGLCIFGRPLATLHAVGWFKAILKWPKFKANFRVHQMSG